MGGNLDNIFAAKFNASGDIVWAENPTGSGYDNYCSGIATDMAENVYLTGSFVGNYLNFNTSSITAPVPDENPLFVAKLDTNGNQIWGKTFVDAGGEEGRNILVDPAGAVYITGGFTDATFSFGNVSLTNLGSNDIFLAKMDTAGNVLWAKSAGGNNIDIVDDLSADDSGNVYLTRTYSSSSVSFGTLTLNNNSSGTNEYLAKSNSVGEAKWVKNIFVDSVDNGAIGINVPAIGIGQGNVYMVSRFNLPSITLDTITLADAAYPNYYSSFFAKFGIPQSGGGNDTNNLITTKMFTPDLKIFPNPSSDGEITLTSPLFNGQPVAITIFDIKGKLVEEVAFSGKTKVQNTLHLKLHLSPGVYFLTLKVKEGSVTKTIVIRE